MIVKQFFGDLDRLVTGLNNELGILDLSIDFSVSAYREGRVNCWVYFSANDEKTAFNIQFNAHSDVLNYDNLYQFLRLAIEFNIQQKKEKKEVINYEL